MDSAIFFEVALCSIETIATFEDPKTAEIEGPRILASKVYGLPGCAKKKKHPASRKSKAKLPVLCSSKNIFQAQGCKIVNLLNSLAPVEHERRLAGAIGRE